MRGITAPAGERTLVFRRRFSSLPLEVEFESATEAGGPPSGTVERVGSRWILGRTTSTIPLSSIKPAAQGLLGHLLRHLRHPSRTGDTDGDPASATQPAAARRSGPTGRRRGRGDRLPAGALDANRPALASGPAHVLQKAWKRPYSSSSSSSWAPSEASHSAGLAGSASASLSPAPSPNRPRALTTVASGSEGWTT